MATPSLRTIQTIIDDNKQKLGDDLYLKLCNETKKMYTKRVKKPSVYEVGYLFSHIDADTDEDCVGFFNTYLKKHKALITLTNEEFKNIKEAIDRNGFSYTHSSLIDKIRNITYESLPSGHIIDKCDCADEWGGSPKVSINYINVKPVFIILKIKKV